MTMKEIAMPFLLMLARRSFLVICIAVLAFLPAWNALAQEGEGEGEGEGEFPPGEGEGEFPPGEGEGEGEFPPGEGEGEFPPGEGEAGGSGNTAQMEVIDQMIGEGLLPNNQPVTLFALDACLVGAGFLESITFTFGTPDDPCPGPMSNPLIINESLFNQIALWRDVQDEDDPLDGIWDPADLLIANKVVRAGDVPDFPTVLFDFNNVITGLVEDTEGVLPLLLFPSCPVEGDPDITGRDFVITVTAPPDIPNGICISAEVPVGGFTMLPPEARPDDPVPAEDPVGGESFVGVSFGVFSNAGGWDGANFNISSQYSELTTHAYSAPFFIMTYSYEVPFDNLRPRFDSGDTPPRQSVLLPNSLAEILPMEVNTAVLAIEAHGGRNADEDPNLLAFFQQITVTFSDLGGVTGQGARPGSGGFDPREGLAPLSFFDGSALGAPLVHSGLDLNTPLDGDVSFNGITLWRDGGSGLWDPPTFGAEGGVTFGEDLPYNGVVTNWSYDPDPVEVDPLDLSLRLGDKTGVPEWEVTLFPLERRPADPPSILDDALEPEIDAEPAPWGTPLMDFYIAIRPDSGFTHEENSVTRPGDGTGIEFGADFRAFIKPGNILLSTQRTFSDYTVGAPVVFAPQVGFDVPDILGSSLSYKPVLTGLNKLEIGINTSEDTNSDNVFSPSIEDEDGDQEFDSLRRGTVFAGPSRIVNCFAFGNFVNPLGFFDRNPAALWIAQSDTRPATMIMDVHDLVINFGPEQNPFFIPLPGRATGSCLTPDQDFGRLLGDQPSGAGVLSRSDFLPGIALPDLEPLQRRRRVVQKVMADLLDEDETNLTVRLFQDGAIPMLGINLVNTLDPITSFFNNLKIAQITVALLGDGFRPSDLLPITGNGLSSANLSTRSGLSLWLDVKEDEGFDIGFFNRFHDTEIELDSLEFPLPGGRQWIDVTGDGVADDVNKDGVIDDNDKGYFARMRLTDPFALYDDDYEENDFRGDDLYLVIRSSETLAYDDRIQMVLPAGGIQFDPVGASPATATEPESVELLTTEPIPRPGFKGSPLLESNQELVAVVPVFVDDETPSTMGIPNEDPDDFNEISAAEVVFSLDMAVGKTGREVYWEYAVLEIYPQIIPDPSDPGDPDDPDDPVATIQPFDPMRDLAPFTVDSATSGVGIYRDENDDGIFQEDEDTALIFDGPPDLVGVSGEPGIQLRMVFSSPGTDFWAARDDTVAPVFMLQDDQPNLRQRIDDRFDGDGPGEQADFFIVLRLAETARPGVLFRCGIVGWGPQNSSLPDPDTFIHPPQPTQPSDEYDIFDDHPYGSRALGFIEILPEPDFTDLSFIRSGTHIRQRTAIVQISGTSSPRPGDGGGQVPGEGEGEGEAPSNGTGGEQDFGGGGPSLLPGGGLPCPVAQIALAAEGTGFEVRMAPMRKIRDSQLLESGLGSSLTTLYYADRAGGEPLGRHAFMARALGTATGFMQSAMPWAGHLGSLILLATAMAAAIAAGRRVRRKVFDSSR